MSTATLSRFAFALGLLALVVACGSEVPKIRMDGSSTVSPITEAVVEEFVHEFPGQYKPTVGVSGTGGGFKKFCRDETDLTNASRGIKPKEVKDCLANGIRFLELTVAYDGLSIVVHPSNTWVDHLTVAELKKIWEPEAQGRITRWNQIRPEWPDKEIHLYGAGVASGTYDYFTEAIVGKSHSSRGDYTSSEDDNVLLTGVAGDPLSLGFFGIAYYEENKQNLKLVPVDDEKPENGAGPIIPTRANIMSNRYAPLSRPLFVYVNSAATQRPEVQRFVRFYLDRVAGLVDEVGYVPLPDSLYARERRNFEAFLQANAASTPVRSPQP